MGVLDLLLPVSCCSCGARGPVVCGECAELADLTSRQRVLADGLNVYSGAEYDSVVREAVLAVKRTGSVKLQTWLADLGNHALLRCASDLAVTNLTLVPLHSGRATFARSGVDLPLALARRLVRLAPRQGLKVSLSDGLRRAHRRSSQKGLSTEQRSRNAHNSLRVRTRSQPLAGAVILFDDVVTTGASLGEAQRVGQAAGWDVVGAVTIASTTRRTQSFDQDFTPAE